MIETCLGCVIPPAVVIDPEIPDGPVATAVLQRETTTLVELADGTQVPVSNLTRVLVTREDIRNLP